MQYEGESRQSPRGLDEKTDKEHVAALRTRLDEPDYMSVAIQSLARELTIEIMESTYGVPFR